MVEGSRELCLRKLEEQRLYVTDTYVNLTSSTGKKKECCETLNTSREARKGEKFQPLRFKFSFTPWHVEYLPWCEEFWQVSALMEGVA